MSHKTSTNIYLLTPNRKRQHCVDVLFAVVHWLPVAKQLGLEVLHHVLHHLPVGSNTNTTLDTHAPQTEKASASPIKPIADQDSGGGNTH